MFVPHMPSRPADIYTIRISDHEAQTNLAMSLRRLVIAAGGTFMINLMEGPGFMLAPIAEYTKQRVLIILPDSDCLHRRLARLRLTSTADC